MFFLRTIAFCQNDRLVFFQFPTVQTSDRDTTNVGREIQRSDQQLGISILDLTWWEIFQDLIQEWRNRCCRLFPIFRHPTIFSRTVDRWEFQLLFVCIQFEHQIEYFFVYFVRCTIVFVNFVDHQQGFDPHRQRFSKNETRLRHWTLESIHQQTNSVCHVQYTFNLTSKVGVTRSVDDVDLCSFVSHRYVLRHDGNPSFAFQVVVIHDQFSCRTVALVHYLSCFNHFINQGRLTVVNVCNNCDVSNFHFLNYECRNYQLSSEILFKSLT